ncbi:MAG: DUF2213 domain-containing protein, partial [Selenomonas artemidis]
GTYEQMDIIGNHVAVVDAGRAGHDVSIRDAKTKPEGGKQMAKKSILHRMFAAFAKDAEPEEVREAARAVDEAEGGGEETPQEAQGKDIAALMNAVEALNAKVDAFVKSQTQDDEPKPEEAPAKETESLDELEEELKGGAPAPTEDEESEEESVTVPPEQLEEDEDLQEQETESESNEARPAADKALALSVIRAMKPIIAAMPQAQQRRASDALSKAVKKAMKTKDSQPMPGGYGALARRKTTDAAAKEKEMRAFGENCRKRNPHCKKEEK